MTLRDRFSRYIAQRQLIKPEDRILLTVSGGVDSMVMLHLFASAGYNVGVAHCNFQLRGAESEEDEVVVEEEARKLGLPFYNMRFNTADEVENSGESVQMVARRLRYAWFNELCDTHGYTRIAIAHHADDSVETFFINMIRGTGLRGLTGINVSNGRLIRPLLFSTRREIVDFAIAEKVPYREDSSNSSTKYLRNKIRLGIIPIIKDISPIFTETMTANVEKLTSAQRFIESSIEMIRGEVVTTEGDTHYIDITRIDEKLPLKFVVYELMQRFGFGGEVSDRLCASMLAGNASGKRFYGRDMVAYIDRERIIITPIDDSDDCHMEIDRNMRKLNCGGELLLFEHIDIDDISSLDQPENIALLDEDKLSYPLRIRRWNDGDSFVPLGMQGHKKVSDFLIDNKVSVPDKKRQFVLLSGEDIVTVIGRRIDDRYKLAHGSENVLRITAIKQV